MVGIVLLVAVSILIFLGLAHRVLDRLYLSDRGGLFLVLALVIGSFIEIPVWRNPLITLNVGGALIPVALAIYVLLRAGTGKEWVRSIIGILLTTGILYGINKFYPFDTHRGFLDPQYIWAIVSGIVAYIAGRSRRLAFIIGTLGVLSMDIVHIIEVARRGINVPTRIGGAGVFDSIVIAGILGVLLAELIGESREAMQGGPAEDGRPSELVRNLKEPDTGKERFDEEDEQ